MEVTFPTIVLGSASPRRKELLASLGIAFEVIVKDVEEILPKNIEPEKAALYLAELKSKAFTDLTDLVVITADTVVVNKGEILGKPKDFDDAFRMIKSLSNGSHEVITGVCIKSEDKTFSFSEATIVHFNELADDEIEYYINEFKPYDKAGAYGIQEWIGAMGISKVDGCYFNVVGLPTSRLYQELKLF